MISRRPGNFFCYAGWFLAVLLACLVLPRIYRRVMVELPPVQRENWGRIMAGKKSGFGVPWQDARPLIVFAGDSHVEMGDWYGLFQGAYAIRNCGLSRAKIADVAELVSALKDPAPPVAVLMCGVNSLAGREPVAACLKDYERLLATVASSLRPQRLVVLSVMQVRESGLDRASHGLNQQIQSFNRQLQALCRQHRAEFLDVNPFVMDDRGGLAAALTVDGLHLNPAGYKKLAAALAPMFAGLNQPATHGKTP